MDGWSKAHGKCLLIYFQILSMIDKHVPDTLEDDKSSILSEVKRYLCTFILTSHPSTVQVKDCIEHTITGRMWVICPVSSNTITDVEMVCVTAADMAAAPVYHKTKTVKAYITKISCFPGNWKKWLKV